VTELSQGLPNNQYRVHQRRSVFTRVRCVKHRMRGARISRNVIILDGVQLLRYPRQIDIGDSVVLKTGAHICPCLSDARIAIGARTTIGFYTLLYASSEIVIGADCMIAPFVHIVDSNHGTRRGIPMNQQPNVTAPIHIGSDVWIGTHAVILKGVTIGDGAVVGAGSVVKTDIPENTIVAGSPATAIGERK